MSKWGGEGVFFDFLLRLPPHTPNGARKLTGNGVYLPATNAQVQALLERQRLEDTDGRVDAPPD